MIEYRNLYCLSWHIIHSFVIFFFSFYILLLLCLCRSMNIIEKVCDILSTYTFFLSDCSLVGPFLGGLGYVGWTGLGTGGGAGWNLDAKMRWSVVPTGASTRRLTRGNCPMGWLIGGRGAANKCMWKIVFIIIILWNVWWENRNV